MSDCSRMIASKLLSRLPSNASSTPASLDGFAEGEGIGVPVDFACTSLIGSGATAGALATALAALGSASNFPDDDLFLNSPAVAFFAAGSLAIPDGAGGGEDGSGFADASICFTRSSLIGAGFAGAGAGF